MRSLKPMILDEIDRRVQLEMERLSLKSDYEKTKRVRMLLPRMRAHVSREDRRGTGRFEDRAELNMK
jgi:hypothetical protein